MSQENIRNFVIVAHIDHGKSTLADRFLEITGTVSKREMHEQFLDQMDLEREKGITIKMQPVRMSYQLKAISYQLNLIDTPGHVDFSYEVSRSLAAVEGAILLVDATQGIQAQTLANFRMARAQGLTIIGALTKVDLEPPNLEDIKNQVAELIGFSREEILLVSGKTGEGVEMLLQKAIKNIPPPAGSADSPLRALVFDSHYDAYKGVIAYVKIVDGSVRKGQALHLFATGTRAEALEVGIFQPRLEEVNELSRGEIGYIATGIKEAEKVKVGDTITSANSRVQPLPGYREPRPLVFASFFPKEADGFKQLRDALEKLKVNDSALNFVPVRQEMLGQGFRVGILGTLHLEIVKERLQREYKIEPVITLPSVLYHAVFASGKIVEVPTPQELPPSPGLEALKEPWVKAEILIPAEFLGSTLGLIQNNRGRNQTVETLGREVLLRFEIPLAEIIVDFYDKLKSVTRGYGSLAYELDDWRAGDLVRVDILVMGEPVEAFARILPRAEAEPWGRATIEKLKEILPREVFPVPIQAAIGSQILARVTMPALKKDVTGYLYGGDRTRKMKLWKKQQRGKKKLAEMGKVEIPSNVYFKLLRSNHE
ncbi:MAG: elongation factor 4 [Parcubacteria group bacterium]|nr:elongation factor 4 [Parcubacteria group bacterium]